MKNTVLNKGLLTVLCVMVMIALFGCSSGLNGKAESDGVSVEVKIDTEKNKPGNTVYHIYSTFTNSTDKELMYIKYHLSFLDEKGELLFEMFPAWKGEDTALTKGNTVKDEIHIQHEEAAKSISVEIMEIKDIEEIPTVHLPEVGEYVYQALNNEHMNNILIKHPDKIEIVIDHMGAQETAEITDEETISELVELFAQATIAAETDVWVTDNYNGVNFIFGDEAYYMSLNLVTLEFYANGKEHLYAMNGFEPFWMMCNELASFE